MPRSPSPPARRRRSPSRSRSRSSSRSRSYSPVKRKTRRESSVEKSHAEQGKCPFLIRLFITKNKHTSMQEFDEGRLPLSDEFQVYGWADSTPSSLIQLLLPSFPPIYRSPLARFSFRHIYVDASQRGLYRSKDLVSFTGRDLMDTALPLGLETLEDEPRETTREEKMDMDLDYIPSVNKLKGERGKRRVEIAERTLDQYGFITGDLLSVCLNVPEPRGLGGQGMRRPMGQGAGPGVGPGPVAGTGLGIKGRAGPVQEDMTRPWGRGGPLPPQSRDAPHGHEHGSGPNGRRPFDNHPPPSSGVDAERWGHIGDKPAFAAPSHPSRSDRAQGDSGRDRDREREQDGPNGRAPPPHISARDTVYGSRGNEGRQAGRHGRSRSPDYTRGGARRDSSGERHRTGDREGGRREAWADRR